MEPEVMTHEVQLHFNREFSGVLTLQMNIQVNWTEGVEEEDAIELMLKEAFPGADYISHYKLED